jgi:hypothetical protein
MLQRKCLFLFFVTMLIVMSFVRDAYAQLVVDNKNINDNPDIEYAQLLYYIDKGNYKPVYFIDIGAMESEMSSGAHQHITIDTVPVNSNMTPVLVLNKLYKAGWEYIGDAIYIALPLRDDWHVFTLKRRKDLLQHITKSNSHQP